MSIDVYHDNDTDEEFEELVVLVAFPVEHRFIRNRPDHFSKWNNQEFFDRFRVSKETAQFVLDLIGEQIACATNRNNALPPAKRLLLTLRYYATGSFLANCGDFSGVHKSTASRIVAKVSHHLALLRPTFINFPETAEEKAEVQQQFYNIAKFPKCLGALDCTHIKIKSPGGDQAECYRNRKGFFSVNVQTICDAQLRIQDIVCRWPGSSHDSTIFDNSYIRGRFERNEMNDAVLVGDSGYALKRYVMTPFPNPTTEGQNRFNESQIRTRNPIERSYGVWKRRFPVLATGIRLDIETVEAVVVGTAVLHNIANHFGDAVPRVSRVQERHIALGQFGNGDGNRAFGIPVAVRNSYVRYFESL